MTDDKDLQSQIFALFEIIVEMNNFIVQDRLGNTDVANASLRKVNDAQKEFLIDFKKRNGL